MERGDIRRDGRGSLHYRETFGEADSKRTRHSSLKKSVHKKHSRPGHHQRYSSASDADAKRANYEENPHNWSECDSSQGRKYWFNIRTEKSQWEVPKAIQLKRSKEREVNSRPGRDYFSPGNSECRRGQQNSHSSDYHFTSPLKREDEIDASFLSNSTNSPANSTGSQNLASLHPLQQALIVKNQLEHSTQPNNSTIPFKRGSSSLTSPSASNESSFLLAKPTNSNNSVESLPSLPSLGRHDLRPYGSVKFPTHRGMMDSQHTTTSSHLDKFANTPGIRIKRKPIVSTSSEGTFKFSSSTTFTPVDIVIPECTTELLHDPELMNSSLLYPFSSPDLEYTEKELHQRRSERLNTLYPDHLDSLIQLTYARLNWEIDNCFSQIYSKRASSLASLIESNQLSNS